MSGRACDRCDDPIPDGATHITVLSQCEYEIRGEVTVTDADVLLEVHTKCALPPYQLRAAINSAMDVTQ